MIEIKPRINEVHQRRVNGSALLIDRDDKPVRTYARLAREFHARVVHASHTAMMKGRTRCTVHGSDVYVLLFSILLIFFVSRCDNYVIDKQKIPRAAIVPSCFCFIRKNPKVVDVTRRVVQHRNSSVPRIRRNTDGSR